MMLAPPVEDDKEEREKKEQRVEGGQEYGMFVFFFPHLKAQRLDLLKKCEDNKFLLWVKKKVNMCLFYFCSNSPSEMLFKMSINLGVQISLNINN